MSNLVSIEEANESNKGNNLETGDEVLPVNSPFAINSPSITRSNPVSKNRNHNRNSSEYLPPKPTPRSKKRLSLIIDKDKVMDLKDIKAKPKSLEGELKFNGTKFEVKDLQEIQYQDNGNNDLKLNFKIDEKENNQLDSLKDYISGTDFAHLVVDSNQDDDLDENGQNIAAHSDINHLEGTPNMPSPYGNVPPRLPPRDKTLSRIYTNLPEISPDTINKSLNGNGSDIPLNLKSNEDFDPNQIANFTIVSPTLSPKMKNILPSQTSPGLSKILQSIDLSIEKDDKQSLVHDLVVNFSKLEVGAEPIWDRMKLSINSSKAITRFLRRRAAIEEEYGKSMMKSIQSTLKELEKEEIKGGTFNNSFNDILKLHDEVAKSKIRLASHTYSIAEELAYVAKEKEALRKMQRETGARLKKSLNEAEINLEKIKARYLHSTETWEKAILSRVEQTQLDIEQSATQAANNSTAQNKPYNPIVEAFNSMFTQPRSADALKKAEEDAKARAINVKRLYSQNVNVVNHMRHEYFNQQLPDLIKESIHCVEECDRASKAYLDLYVARCTSAFEETNNILSDNEKGLKALVNKIEPHQDNLEYFAKFLSNSPANRDPYIVSDYSMSPLAQSALNPKVIYGVSLDELYERDGTIVPIMIKKCINFVERKGIDSEGIYRRSGASTKINRLKELFNLDSEQVDLDNLEIAQDVDSVTGALKLFLRELPHATVSSSNWESFYSAYKLSNSSREEKISLYVKAVSSLVETQAHLLAYLIQHLKRVANHEHENKMSISNVAIVFGPTIFEPPLSGNVVEMMGFQCGVTMELLSLSEEIFKNFEVGS